MERIEKTVFISYRRANFPWALAVFQDLTQHGFDVFIDFRGINSGSFETVILENIKARAHFVVLLTPSALEHCGEPGDWLRREIETALEVKRNIIPLLLEGFNFSAPNVASQLNGSLAALKEYNGLEVPAAYFSEAVRRLRDDYLSVPLNAVLRPPSVAAQQAAKDEQQAASTAPAVAKTELAELDAIVRPPSPAQPIDKNDQATAATAAAIPKTQRTERESIEVGITSTTTSRSLTFQKLFNSKALITIVATIVVIAVAYRLSATTLHWVVLNAKTREPLQDARVTLASAQGAVLADGFTAPNGGIFFKLHGLGSSAHVYAHAEGFQSLSRPVTIRSGQDDELALEPLRAPPELTACSPGCTKCGRDTAGRAVCLECSFKASDLNDLLLNPNLTANAQGRNASMVTGFNVTCTNMPPKRPVLVKAKGNILPAFATQNGAHAGDNNGAVDWWTRIDLDVDFGSGFVDGAATLNQSNIKTPTFGLNLEKTGETDHAGAVRSRLFLYFVQVWPDTKGNLTLDKDFTVTIASD